MVSGIKARLNDQEVFMEINGSRVLVSGRKRVSGDGSEGDFVVVKDIPLTDIRSIHVKSSERHLLRLKLAEESVVFSFDSHHSRDVTKSILLSYMKTEEEILKKILESDPSTMTIFNNLKQHISPSKFWSINKDKMRKMSCIVRQQPSKEINMEDNDFVSMLNPTLLKIFGQMNCSPSQFYNLLNQSYFSNIKNPKNSLDRMINEVVREYETKQDFASRINSYSILALKPIESMDVHIDVRTGKKIEFLPIYPFEENREEKKRREFRFEKKTLKCDIELSIEPMTDRIVFEKRDLVWIRDLSKVVYKAMKQNDEEFVGEAREATRKFLENIEKKYGNGRGMYLSRILPTRFIKDR